MAEHIENHPEIHMPSPSYWPLVMALGVTFVLVGIVVSFYLSGLGLLVGRFINRWGEERMIQVGLLSSAIGFVLFLLTFDMVSMIVVMGTMGLGNTALRPAINSLVSKRTPAATRVLIAAARYLAAHAPPVRAQGQTYEIARRLHRGEKLFEE